jgi:acyl-coenzyme A thioesterase PaaI-like protein
MEILNREWLPSNDCFVCGHENPNGLKIEIRRDPGDRSRLTGTFRPAEDMIGFPGITHGGAIYSTLDCMAFWTAAVQCSHLRACWILREANIRYLRPAHQGNPLALVSWLEKNDADWEPVTVRCEARDENNRALARGSFEVVPLPPKKFNKVANIDELPENWKHLLDRIQESQG